MSETRGDVTGGGLAEAVLALADEWERLYDGYDEDDEAGRGCAADLRAAVAAATAETPPTPEATTGASLIAAERQRQIEAEGFTPAHDAEHGGELLAWAANCYLNWKLPPGSRTPLGWPWAREDWKPSTRERNLVKAGALIAAAIDALRADQ